MGRALHATGTANDARNRMGRCAGAAALLLAGTALAAQHEDDGNAATWYRTAIERYAATGLTEQDETALDDYDPRSGRRPPESVRALLARLEPVFSAMRRAAAQEFSDFGLDYGQGYDMLLPHLHQLRVIGFWVQREAGVRMYDGDSAGAADSIASLYRMSAHLSEDRVLISSLVGQAVFIGADRIAQYGLDSAAFAPDDCGSMLAVLEAMPPGDPFNIIGGLAIESMMIGWMREKYPDAQSRVNLPRDFGLPTDSGQAQAMLLLDDEQFNAAVDGASELMGRVADVFKLEDPDEARLELQCLEEEVLRGEHGPIAALVIPAYGRAYDSLTRAREALARRIGQLRAVASGECSPSELVNAAEWYLRAVEMIQELDVGFRAQHSRIVRDMKPIDADTQARLASAGVIIDTLRAGSQAPRCDFSIAGGRPRAVPAYLPGLREAFRLLQADALRLLHEGARDQGADRLAIAYRMSAHLAGDPQIALALVAHAGFQDTAAIAGQAIGALEDAQRAELAAALRAMPARDPFGYMGAFERARRDVLKELRPDAGIQSAVERLVQESGGDRLMYLLVVATERGGEIDESAAWQPLADVLSLDALLAARGQAEAARALLAESGSLAALVPEPLPDIGRVRERFTRAMSDYRAAVAELEPAAKARGAEPGPKE